MHLMALGLAVARRQKSVVKSAQRIENKGFALERARECECEERYSGAAALDEVP